MSATRIQVYLTEEQRRRIDELSDAEGVSLAEIVRRAGDHYLDTLAPGAGKSQMTFDAIPDMLSPDRGEWVRTPLRHREAADLSAPAPGPSLTATLTSMREDERF